VATKSDPPFFANKKSDPCQVPISLSSRPLEQDPRDSIIRNRTSVKGNRKLNWENFMFEFDGLNSQSLFVAKLIQIPLKIRYQFMPFYTKVAVKSGVLREIPCVLSG
jgi:hypothetical protein